MDTLTKIYLFGRACPGFGNSLDGLYMEIVEGKSPLFSIEDSNVKRQSSLCDISRSLQVGTLEPECTDMTLESSQARERERTQTV